MSDDKAKKTVIRRGHDMDTEAYHKKKMQWVDKLEAREYQNKKDKKTVPGRPWRELYGKKELDWRKKKAKEFQLKRDKDGSGFTMMMSKKIKGFEEGAEMVKNKEINELAPSTLRSFNKKASVKIGKLAYNVGLKGGPDASPEAKHDAKRAKGLAWGIDKASVRLGGIYRPKYVRVRNPHYGGTRKYEGAYSSHKFYQPSEDDKKEKLNKYGRMEKGHVPYNYKDMGDRERFPRKMGRLHPYKANEEIEQYLEWLGQLDEDSFNEEIATLSEEEIEMIDEVINEAHPTWSNKSRDPSMRKPAAPIGPKKWEAREDDQGNTFSRRVGTKKWNVSRASNEEVEELDENVSRKHFKLTAETVSKIADKDERQKHAQIHADNYAKMNPRFNRDKFMQACKADGVSLLTKEENEMIMNEDEQEPEISVSDLVLHSIDQKPIDFQKTFDDLMNQRISDNVYEKKLEIASGYVTGPEDYDDDEVEQDEYEDESSDEGEEETEA